MFVTTPTVLSKLCGIVKLAFANISKEYVGNLTARKPKYEHTANTLWEINFTLPVVVAMTFLTKNENHD